MTPEEQHFEFQPRSTFSTWLGVLLLFAFFGLLALVVMNASPRGSEYEQRRAQARMEKLKTVQTETAKALTTYAWVDKNKGVARIPISDAMKIAVTELATKKPAPANPIAAPTASVAPAGATQPGAQASPGAAQPPASNQAPVAPSPAASPTAAKPLPVPGKSP